MHSTRLKRSAATTLVALAAIGLTSCYDASERPAVETTSTLPANASASTTDHNAQDVTFAQMMIAHHEGALEMAELANSRAANPEVKAIAQKIAAEQGPEIATMRNWLETWSEPTTMAGPHAEHMMPGMMSEAQMTELREASGAAFDKRFLELMQEHHEGAVTMAKEVVSKGKASAVKDLATAVIASQTAEIAQMSQLLQRL